MIRLIIVRHGQTVKNEQGYAQGHGDSDLTEKGMLQVSKAREFLRDYKIDAAFSSDLGRAIKTAKMLCSGRGIDPLSSKDLRELNWGDLSSSSTDTLLQRWSEYYESEKSKGIPIEEIRPRNGENSFDHMKRVKRVMDKIISDYKDKTVLIVAHGGTNKVLIGLLKKVTPEEFYTIKQENACINILDLDNKGNILRMELNITDHLK